jgi:hypothetical protein
MQDLSIKINYKVYQRKSIKSQVRLVGSYSSPGAANDVAKYIEDTYNIIAFVEPDIEVEAYGNNR